MEAKTKNDYLHRGRCFAPVKDIIISEERQKKLPIHSS